MEGFYRGVFGVLYSLNTGEVVEWGAFSLERLLQVDQNRRGDHQRGIGNEFLLINIGEEELERDEDVIGVLGELAVTAGESIVLTLCVEADEGELLALMIWFLALDVGQLVDFPFCLLGQHLGLSQVIYSIF